MRATVTRPKKTFEDSAGASFSLSSSWKQSRASRARRSAQTQTSAELFQLDEREVQSGRYTRIIQDEISAAEKGVTLVDHLCGKHTRLWPTHTHTQTQTSTQTGTDAESEEDVLRERWTSKIRDGLVTVDCEVSADPLTLLEAEAFVEFVDVFAHAGTQTESDLRSANVAPLFPSSSSSAAVAVSAVAEAKDAAQSKAESKQESKVERAQRSALAAFLSRVSPRVLDALSENLSTASAFLSLSSALSAEPSAAERASLAAWKLLSVDLEKRRVVFPDWQKAAHHRGTVARCVLTRNKERVYDVDFEDGGRVCAVREEHIRALDSNTDNSNGNNKRNSAPPKLQEGMRVHARVIASGSARSAASGATAKYLPARILRIARASAEVELEGGRTESVSLDDIVVGLREGQRVEARQPRAVSLQAAALHWSATGSALAVVYGKQDVSGWNNHPGALCVWNVFGKAFNAANPDVVFDHAVGLCAVAFHPCAPSIVAAGSLNGELLVWDLAASANNAEPLQALSPMSEYAHKDAVVALQWVPSGSSGSDALWLLSVGVDGKMLFWTLANRLRHPIKGFLLARNKGTSRRNVMQSCHAASSLALSCGSYAFNKQLKPKWVVVGQQGGAILKTQFSKLNSSHLNAEMLKSNPSIDEVFPALKRGDDGTTLQAHVGAVFGIDWSPFHRNLFLSGGSDGVVKLRHVLEQSELRRWEVLAFIPDADTSGAAITCVKFSPIRPLLFGVTTSNGYLMLFDLEDPVNRPAVVVFAEASEAEDEQSAKDSKKRSKSSKQQSVGSPLTSLSFNHKQRDLIAASDWSGKVYVWKMSWSLSTMKPKEQEILDRLGNLSVENEDTEK